MHRFSSLIVACMIASPVALWAQGAGFVGVVGDSVTGAPILGATISIPDLGIETTTGQDGYFRLAGIRSGELVVFVRHEEYEPWAARLRVTVEDERDVSLGAIILRRAHEAAFFGLIADSLTGAVLEGVEISLAESDLHTVTDDEGAFRIEGVRSGEHTVLIRRIGYAVWAQTFTLDVTRPMQVDFGTIGLVPTGAVALEEIVVEGEAFRASSIMRDFLHRKRTEKGTFFTYEDIDRLNPDVTSEMLRSVPGFNVRPGGVITSRRGTASLSGFNECEVEYFIDGVHVTASSLDVIMPRAVAGMEIYTGSSTIPQVFRRSSLDAKCGIVAVWTKDASYRVR